MKLIKSARDGVYTRTHNRTGIISYIITYKIDGKLYKKKLGTNIEGWNIHMAFKERAKRIGINEAPISKKISSVSLDDIAQEYFLSISHKSDYKNTIGRYSNYISPILGHKEIRSITVVMIQSFKLELSKVISNKTGRILSPKSINDRLDLVNTIYNYYNKLHYLNPIRSPAKNSLVERYSIDNSRVRFLTKQEYQQLLVAIENRRDYTPYRNVLELRTKEMLLYVKLLTTTGIRTYSALTLRVKDFDFDNGTIQVNNHKCNRIYTSFIHPSIKEELEVLCKTLSQEYYIFGCKDKPYHRSTINKRLLPLMDLLFNHGVADRRERVVVHTLRHTFGSWLAQKGVSLYIISKLMDHKEISMTQRYSKFTDNSGIEYIKDICI